MTSLPQIIKPLQDELLCFKDSKNALHKILKNGVQNLPAKQHSQFSWRGPNRLCCLAGRFYAAFPRISCKAFLESLKQTHSCCESLIYWRYNFIQMLLRLLCYINAMRDICTMYKVEISNQRSARELSQLHATLLHRYLI